MRITLASVLALVLMETLQMPFISVGMYFVFLIGRDSPAVSLRSSIFSFAIVVLAIAVELSVVTMSDNNPVARLLSVAAVTFVAGMIVVSTNFPALGSSFGLIYCTVISLWELHAPADRLVKTSLYLVGTFVISLVSAVAVEYLFGDRHPAERLQEQRRIRYAALEAMFRAYAENAPAVARAETASRVSHIAVAGQSGMMALVNTIKERNLDTGTLPIAVHSRITMLAQLMDVAAAFGLQHFDEVDPSTRERCERIADACRRLIPGIAASPGEGLRLGPQGSYSLLDRVEGSLHAILTMPSNLGLLKNVGPLQGKELVTLPSSKVPFFIPGALRSRDCVAFGLKISLCATLCYILYHALDWSGTATSVTTVLVTGLSTTGAIKQKFVFRLLGSIIGGFVLGIGATVFLFPHMDTITSLIVLEAFIALLSGWVAAGPKFNYIGLQIAFSFYIVSYEGFTAPTELAPARDRLAGILIALAIMWVVFDQLWPVRTTTVMRRSLASVLRLGADLFTSIDSAEPRQDILHHTDILRDQIGKTIAAVRSMDTSVPYEFGADREQHIQTGDMVVRAAVTATALFWNQLVVLHSEADSDFLTHPGLREMRRRIAERMIAMADAIVQQSMVSVEVVAVAKADTCVTPALLADARFGDYARNTAARYEELQDFTATLSLRP